MAGVFAKENQMILRVPDEIADKLNKLFDNEKTDNPMIDISPMIQKNENNEDTHQFKFKFEDFESIGTLVDLPCIIESQKSVDDINFFKSNDIS